MVFVPTNVQQKLNAELPTGNRDELRSLTNALNGQYTSYALLTTRSVGDQPGRHTLRYITPWRTLPEGMLFAPYKFANNPSVSRLLFNEYDRPFQYSEIGLNPSPYLPFPNVDSIRRPNFFVPYIAFNSQGQLTDAGRDEIIPLVEGSVSMSKSTGNATFFLEAPAKPDTLPTKDKDGVYQFIRINWLTGRARVMDSAEIQLASP
jgi:hypothetical protein